MNSWAEEDDAPRAGTPKWWKQFGWGTAVNNGRLRARLPSPYDLCGVPQSIRQSKPFVPPGEDETSRHYHEMSEQILGETWE